MNEMYSLVMRGNMLTIKPYISLILQLLIERQGKKFSKHFTNMPRRSKASFYANTVYLFTYRTRARMFSVSLLTYDVTDPT